MRVLHVSTAKTWRGGEQQLANLCQGLAVKGCQQMVALRAGVSMATAIAVSAGSVLE